jgi:hypothetical protein
MNLSWLVWSVGCRIAAALVAIVRFLLPADKTIVVVNEINTVGVRGLGLALTPQVRSR